MEWLKNFDVQRWWKAAIVVGLAVIVAALAIKERDIVVVGFGVVACGFGEWMNHRMETEIRHGGTLTTFERKNRPLGLALDAIGVVLIVLGFYGFIYNH
jgi:hypothetical protein